MTKEEVTSRIIYDVIMQSIPNKSDALREEMIRDNTIVHLKNLINEPQGSSYWPEVQAAMAIAMKSAVYRLKLNQNSSVDIECYDLIENYFPELERYYDHVDYLPKWVQSKLAVLMVIDPTAMGGREVEGVGKRINKVVFWIYSNGNDTRGEGQEGSQASTG